MRQSQLVSGRVPNYIVAPSFPTGRAFQILVCALNLFSCVAEQKGESELDIVTLLISSHDIFFFHYECDIQSLFCRVGGACSVLVRFFVPQGRSNHSTPLHVP